MALLIMKSIAKVARISYPIAQVKMNEDSSFNERKSSAFPSAT
jgi:hypothetical protein